MKLQDQVCSLEISKRLKELGCKQESLFWWWQDTFGFNKEAFIKDHDAKNPKGGWNCISAFTVAELGEIITKLSDEELENIPSHLLPEGDREFAKALFSAENWGKVIVYLLGNKLIKL